MRLVAQLCVRRDRITVDDGGYFAPLACFCLERVAGSVPVGQLWPSQGGWGDERWNRLVARILERQAEGEEVLLRVQDEESKRALLPPGWLIGGSEQPNGAPVLQLSFHSHLPSELSRRVRVIRAPTAQELLGSFADFCDMERSVNNALILPAAKLIRAGGWLQTIQLAETDEETVRRLLPELSRVGALPDMCLGWDLTADFHTRAVVCWKEGQSNVSTRWKTNDAAALRLVEAELTWGQRPTNRGPYLVDSSEFDERRWGDARSLLLPHRVDWTGAANPLFATRRVDHMDGDGKCWTVCLGLAKDAKARPGAACAPPPARTLVGAVRGVHEGGTEGASGTVIELEVEGAEQDGKTLLTRPITPSVGADGKGGVHVLPRPGTPALLLDTGRLELPHVCLGSLREAQTVWPSPSLHFLAEEHLQAEMGPLTLHRAGPIEAKPDIKLKVGGSTEAKFIGAYSAKYEADARVEVMKSLWTKVGEDSEVKVNGAWNLSASKDLRSTAGGDLIQGSNGKVEVTGGGVRLSMKAGKVDIGS